ncbi:MAG: metal-dependent hydrolase [Chloroflexota bacterium]
MSFMVTWLGHNAFKLDIDGYSVLLDPFITGNPTAAADAQSIHADYIVVSHGHGDHVGDTFSIAERTGATVISNFEIVNWFSNQGLTSVHPQHIGGGFNYPFGYLKLTIAQHGSALPDGSYGGNPAGVIIRSNEGKIAYFACDTGLFASMKLYGEEGLDLAVLPIGDNFTMGPDDAIRAVELLQPQLAVPVHYNTFDIIEQDPHQWAQRVEARTATKVVVMNPGESITL